jgi:hypothetical protein
MLLGMKQATRWTEAQGQEVVRRWRRSGQSMYAFAREHGLDPQRVRYWRERAEATGAKPRSGGLTTQPLEQPVDSGRLVPAVVVGLNDAASVSVHVGRGVVVEAQGVEALAPDWIAELVRALEETS